MTAVYSSSKTDATLFLAALEKAQKESSSLKERIGRVFYSVDLLGGIRWHDNLKLGKNIGCNYPFSGCADYLSIDVIVHFKTISGESQLGCCQTYLYEHQVSNFKISTLDRIYCEQGDLDDDQQAQALDRLAALLQGNPVDIKGLKLTLKEEAAQGESKKGEESKG